MRLLTVIIFALALTGCVEDVGDGGGSEAGACADAFDCSAGFFCEGGQCVRPGCQSDDDCSLGFLCIEARCAEAGSGNNGGGNNGANNGGGNNGANNGGGNNGANNGGGNNGANNGGGNNGANNGGNNGANNGNNGGPVCTDDNECEVFEECCSDGQCAQRGSCAGGNDGNNNGGNNNGGNNNGNPPAGDCRAACQHLLVCSSQICLLPVVDVVACETACQQDNFAGEVLGLTCEQVNENLCQDLTVQLTCICGGGFGDNDTNAGDACTTDAQCDGGALQGLCITEINPDTNEQTDWDGGYCTAANCQNDEQCGADNICVQVNEQGDTFCFHECNPFQNTGCRNGYVCLELTTTGVCIPDCDDNEDCPDGQTCNGQTGLCE